MQWFGHVVKGSNDLARDVLLGEVERRRLRGRSRLRWKDYIV